MNQNKCLKILQKFCNKTPLPICKVFVHLHKFSYNKNMICTMFVLRWKIDINVNNTFRSNFKMYLYFFAPFFVFVQIDKLEKHSICVFVQMLIVKSKKILRCGIEIQMKKSINYETRCCQLIYPYWYLIWPIHRNQLQMILFECLIYKYSFFTLNSKNCQNIQFVILYDSMEWILLIHQHSFDSIVKWLTKSNNCFNAM